MRGEDGYQDELFTYGGLGERVPAAKQPLQVGFCELADAALGQMSCEFEGLYSKIGRPSIAPEQMLRALLLQMLYSVRSERMLVEQLEYNLLFRLVCRSAAERTRAGRDQFYQEPQERLLSGEVAQAFFAAVVAEARRQRLLHDQHFTVDGTLLEAWASEEELSEEAGTAAHEGAPGGAARCAQADTHESVTDPDARMYAQGPEDGLEAAAHGACGEREPAWPGGGHRGLGTCSPMAGTAGRHRHGAGAEADG